jgi:preprotein translocase subunit SecG
MKNGYSKGKTIVFILLSLMMGFLSYPYKEYEIDNLSSNEDVLILILNKMYMVLGEYGPSVFFFLIAIGLSVLLLYRFKKK